MPLPMLPCFAFFFAYAMIMPLRCYALFTSPVRSLPRAYMRPQRIDIVRERCFCHYDDVADASFAAATPMLLRAAASILPRAIDGF